jgi:hypothetical protein
MLFQATLLVDLFAMVICLWMAFYLFARGFPSRVTLMAVLVLLALSVFFLGAVNNLFHQVIGTAALRAALLIIVLTMWYSLTLQLLPPTIRRSYRWLTFGIYLLAFVTGTLLVGTRNAFVREEGNVLYVAHMGVGLPYILYGIFNITISAGILYNLLSHNKVGFTQQGKYFLFASIFPIAAIGYGIFALVLTSPMPRLTQDFLTFSGVFFLGLSVARYQTWVERRTTLQDFPVTSLIILGITLLYMISSLRLGLPLEWIAPLAAFVVLTHATYDLVREFLERIRMRNESTFRKQLRQLENENPAEDTLRVRLQEGLDLLCRAIDASTGLIAIRRGDEFIVAATRGSMPMESRLAAALVSCEDVSQPKAGQLSHLTWIAPSFDGQTQVALLGIGKPNKKLEYSTGDLDLLAEVADQIGTVISLSDVRPKHNEQIRQLVAESRANVTELESISEGMVDAIATNPDPDFIKIVEEGLRNLPDYIVLGQSALADKMAVTGESHIERGKTLHKFLIDCIESLRPAEKRPAEPLPRVWYNHAVLYDAYVEGVPNREIMARLYISEGTFNRTRRNALRGLARLLMEKNKAG